jgi:anhydro-N-acetylmuramic acid kinase
MLSIGLMSGTSMDGIDAALIETDGKFAIEEIASDSMGYDADFHILLKASESGVRAAGGDLAKASSHFTTALENYLTLELGGARSATQEKIRELSLYFHKNPEQAITLNDVIERSTELHINIVKSLLKKSGYAPADISVIGYHGQTLFHRAAILSLQVGNGKLMAEKTGITVVNNFRNKDIAAGGQGAPFAPLYHQALAVRDNMIPAAVVNCGGIANLTLISGPTETDVTGFDTGPGNVLVDRFVKRKTGGKEQMDRDGQYGKKGKVSASLLKLLYQQAIQINQTNYFDLPAPKSLDSGDVRLLPELDALTIEDGCATLAAFTADTIVHSLNGMSADKIPRNWIVAGGGWNNPLIFEEFKKRLTEKYGAVTIKRAAEVGWDNQALEAQIFAFLAIRSLQNLPISLPGTTRVSGPLCGGEVHYAE